MTISTINSSYHARLFSFDDERAGDTRRFIGACTRNNTMHEIEPSPSFMLGSSFCSSRITRMHIVRMKGGMKAIS